jgi:hypothetical protein
MLTVTAASRSGDSTVAVTHGSGGADMLRAISADLHRSPAQGLGWPWHA